MISANRYVAKLNDFILKSTNVVVFLVFRTVRNYSARLYSELESKLAQFGYLCGFRASALPLHSKTTQFKSFMNKLYSRHLARVLLFQPQPPGSTYHASVGSEHDSIDNTKAHLSAYFTQKKTSSR